jgi:multicomponent K+:H+ antiporter subunit E
VKRILPHPGLSALLLLIWLLMLNALSMGGLVLGSIFAIVIPLFTAAFWPDRPLMKWGLPLLGFLLLVLRDIVVANFHVARLILFRRNAELRTAWLSIPLDLRSAEAITLLAGTISLTPGTVSADISTDGRFLLVHALDVADPEAEIANIKSRYERRLMEIFK